jgi:hypothetical protein
VKGAFPIVGLAVKDAMGGGIREVVGRGVGLGVSSGVMVAVGIGEVEVTTGFEEDVGIGEPGGVTGGWVLHPEIATARMITHELTIRRAFIARTILLPCYIFLSDRMDQHATTADGAAHQARRH